MSHNTGASGTIVLPKKIYTSFLKEVAAEYIRLITYDVTLYNELIAQLLVKYKGKRNLRWNQILDDEAYKQFIHNGNSHYNKSTPFHTVDYMVLADRSTSFNEPEKKPSKLKVPKFKLSEPLISFEFGAENGISFNKKEHSVSIHVSFNNHSLEEAQKNSFYKFVLQKLKAVEWIRNSGGQIYSQQEDLNSNYPNTNEHIMYDFKPVKKQ